jgi:hypothetical protein
VIIFSIFLSPAYFFYCNLAGTSFFVNDLSFEASDQDNLLGDQQKEPNGTFPSVLPVLTSSRAHLSEVSTILYCQALFPQQELFNLRC